jgi:hypothetical protein
VRRRPPKRGRGDEEEAAVSDPQDDFDKDYDDFEDEIHRGDDKEDD